MERYRDLFAKLSSEGLLGSAEAIRLARERMGLPIAHAMHQRFELAHGALSEFMRAQQDRQRLIEAAGHPLSATLKDHAASLVGAGGIPPEILRQAEVQTRLLATFGGAADRINELIGASAPVHAQAASMLATFKEARIHEAAMQAAEMAARIHLPDFLEQHRLGAPALADHLTIAGLSRSADASRWNDTGYLSAFSGAAAMAQALGHHDRIGANLCGAMDSLSVEGFAGPSGLRDYQGVLNAAGLVLPRWPQFRPVSHRERAARQRRRLAQHQPSQHVRKAMPLVHQHESYLRQAIDEVMEAEYGENWVEERLPLCGPAGRRLFGKWQNRGGHALDHADYPDYLAIMAHPEHFDAIFAIAFEDIPVLTDLMEKARRLRAASHHPGHEFTAADLRDLRVTWNAIKRGLCLLEGSHEVVFEP
ncbi:conserved protein of unknown function (plasmid) [Rhodovastum atsumiense]|uniref:Swt1-like HEPN domain-containing protein n=1 Tax=Rhodovastum atsumiense TaxID=504468 RepID=A0A5M6IU25_9PROT|nr:hypothetical protein [Rhodovastum atsumiense]KAA5611823.1 hypothetical protein F1189_12355 [Rhodovastum atsumiense]CAH2606066.1 conserved protein of unknown function [Rhodovastum atsumiense]